MSPTRRNFLQSALLFCAGFLSCRKSDSGKAVKSIVLGKAAEFPEGATDLDLYRVRVIRSGETFRAVSLVCTHQPCLLNAHADGFDCPCHGSKFDREGKRLSGPATAPLPWYEVSVSAAGDVVLKR